MAVSSRWRMRRKWPIDESERAKIQLRRVNLFNLGTHYDDEDKQIRTLVDTRPWACRGHTLHSSRRRHHSHCRSRRNDHFGCRSCAKQRGCEGIKENKMTNRKRRKDLKKAGRTRPAAQGWVGVLFHPWLCVVSRRTFPFCFPHHMIDMRNTQYPSNNARR